MIKILSVLLLCLLGSFSVSAQIKKGTVLLGGSISGSTSKSYFDRQGLTPERTTSSGFSVGPSIGFAFGENAVAGLGISYHRSKNNQGNTSQISTAADGYGINLFSRHYLPLSNKFYLFGEGQVFYFANHSTQKQNPDGKLLNDVKNNFVGVGVSPGLTYAVNKKIHLEAQLNNILSLQYLSERYQNFQISPITGFKNKGFSANVNVSPANPFQFTFRFVLGK
ncbi:MAG: outer membrane beta-barrel protein [Chitinophagaceae bacterium]